MIKRLFLVLILPIYINPVILMASSYYYESSDNCFNDYEISEKNRDYRMVIDSFNRYKEIIKDDSIVLYRTFEQRDHDNHPRWVLPYRSKSILNKSISSKYIGPVIPKIVIYDLRNNIKKVINDYNIVKLILNDVDPVKVNKHSFPYLYKLEMYSVINYQYIEIMTDGKYYIITKSLSKFIKKEKLNSVYLNKDRIDYSKYLK